MNDDSQKPTRAASDHDDADRLFERIVAGDLSAAELVAVPDAMREAALAMRNAAALFGAPTRVDRSSEKSTVRVGADARRSFGRFELIEELGRGGQGSVWRAKDPTTGDVVALKFLDHRARLSGSAVARLRREQAVLARLDHPNIARIKDAGVEDETPWIAMELIEGRPLTRWIAERRTRGFHAPIADPSACLRFFEAAARAAHFAHELGILHRDLKPGNIMVTPDGRPMILDFGLAEDVENTTTRVTQTGDLLGTPAYLAPEQLTRQAIRADRRTDVWGLGVALYESLTGRPPFEAPTRERLYAAILAQDPPNPVRIEPAIPKAAAVCLATALEKDRDRRYVDMAAFADDLARIRENRPILARPSAWPVVVARWVARHPARATIIFLTVIFLSLAGYLAARWNDIESGRRAERRARIEKKIAEGYLALGEVSIEAARAIFDECLALDDTSPEAWAGRIIAEGKILEGAAAPATEAEWNAGRNLLAAADRACGDSRALRPLHRYFDRPLTDIQSLSAFIATMPTDSSDAVELFVTGVLFLQLGHVGVAGAFDAATEALLTAALRVEGDSALIDYQLTHAATHANRKDLEKRLARVLRARYPHSATAQFWAGFATIEEDPMAAAEDYRRAIALDPKLLRPQLDLPVALTTANKKDEALIAAKAAALEFPNSHQALSVYASLLVENSDFENASAYAERALMLQKNVPDALLVRGRCAMERQDYEAAEKSFDQAIRVWPNQVSAYRLRSSVRLLRGDAEGGERDLLKAIELNHGQAETRLALAQLYVNQRRGDEARALLDAVEKKDGPSPALYAVSGNLAINGNDFGRAIRDLSRALAGDPKNIEVRRQLAGAYTALGEFEASARIASALDPRDPFTLWAEGLRRFFSGDFRAGLEKLEEAHASGRAIYGWVPRAEDRIAECRNLLAQIEPLVDAVQSESTTDLTTANAGTLVGVVYAARLFGFADRALRLLEREKRFDRTHADDLTLHLFRVTIARAYSKALAATDADAARTLANEAATVLESIVADIAKRLEDDDVPRVKIAKYASVVEADGFMKELLAPDATLIDDTTEERLRVATKRLRALVDE